MINIAEQYKNYLKTVVYGNGYDVRMHGFQTALSVLGYIAKEDVNKNNIQYGYHCVDTENMIKNYQKERGLIVDGIVDEETWDYVFFDLINKHKVTVVQTGERQVSLYDIDKLIESGGENGGGTLGDSNGVVDPNGGDNDSDGIINLPEYDNDLLYPDSNDGFNTNGGGYPGTGFPTLDGMLDYITGGGDTSSFDEIFNTNGGASFDELVYNYIVNGGEVYNGLTYNYNLDGGHSWHDDRLDYVTSGSSNKDYDYIYNLLANSVYEGALRSEPLWTSTSDTDVGKYGGGFDPVTQRPFFSPGNLDKLRRSKFDMTIVYGAKGENARKIVEVTPISVTQEFDASGEPIYDIYEFIAKDVVYGGGPVYEA